MRGQDHGTFVPEAGKASLRSGLELRPACWARSSCGQKPLGEAWPPASVGSVGWTGAAVPQEGPAWLRGRSQVLSRGVGVHGDCPWCGSPEDLRLGSDQIHI